MIRIATLLLCAAIAVPAVAQERTSAPDDARAWFPTLSDGQTVQSPVTVVFGLEGMGVAPAGVEREDTGHHHLLLNRAPFGTIEGEAGEPIPADENHIHFGGGQTQTVLELEPGEHSLQLVLGDWAHVAHEPPVTSDVITIVVE